MNMRPIAQGLLTDEAQPRLIGGRNLATGRIVFPMPTGGEAALYEPYPLKRTGTLWSYTVQRFAPKSPPYAGPQPFEPFAVGYVELSGEVIVESRLIDIPFDQLKIGIPLQMVLEPFSTDTDGNAVYTYAFAPAQEA